MITVEKLEKGTYFDDAFKISFRYDPTTVAKVKELAERRYLPEDRAWEIPAHELPALIEKVTIDADTGKRVYTRKEVADLVGASTQSIRLWEDAGAIPASVRDEGGYRYWYEEDLEAIKAYASLPRKAKLKK